MTPDTAARHELRPGERLLWSGRGDPRVVFSKSDAFIVPFSLLWGGFAIFWESQVLLEGGPSFLPLFGGVFCVIGLYLIVGRFFVKAHRKRTTTYAVTDRRAFTVSGRTTVDTSVKSVDRTTTRSRDRSHVTVVWNSSAWGGYFGGGLFGGGMFGGRRGGWPPNSGLDLFSSQRVMGFFDVSDGAALIAALDQAGDR
ncbi:hypothetical protein AX769_03075 [Frondihabitans sp. PAMC 28766]|nr:hypothetical protein AX769_03075 [Frondihabitans sp. PAMC 28766]